MEMVIPCCARWSFALSGVLPLAPFTRPLDLPANPSGRCTCTNNGKTCIGLINIAGGELAFEVPRIECDSMVRSPYGQRFFRWAPAPRQKYPERNLCFRSAKMYTQGADLQMQA